MTILLNVAEFVFEGICDFIRNLVEEVTDDFGGFLIRVTLLLLYLGITCGHVVLFVYCVLFEGDTITLSDLGGMVLASICFPPMVAGFFDELGWDDLFFFGLRVAGISIVIEVLCYLIFCL